MCMGAVKKVYEKKTFLNLCYDLKSAGNFVLPKLGMSPYPIFNTNIFIC